jgi:phosphoribosylglycinamide formyltransferase-1
MEPEVQRARVRELCLRFPQVSEEVNNPDHSAFVVNGKKFAYFLNSHHGDGVVGMTCKALPGVSAMLVDLDSTRFYLPAYMARHGWVGVRIDIEPVDWLQIEQLLREAFLAMAPKALARQFEAS